MTPKYQLEFTLETGDVSVQVLKNSLLEFGQDLEVNPIAVETKNKDFRIYIRTEDPTLVFDACAEFGRIKSVKVNEVVV